MKRWLVGLLLVIAVLVLLSPGIIGLIAERQIESQLPPVDDAGPANRAVTEHFERRWFTSDGQHRVPLNNADLRKWLQLLVPRTPPLDATATLLIETQVRHGLLPSGSLVPALASGVSTMSIDLAAGQRILLPGELHSRLGLDGQLHLRYPLPAGARSVDALTATLQGGELLIDSGAGGKELSADLRLDGAALSEGGQHLSADALQLHAVGRRGPFGFPVGSTSVQADRLLWSDGQETIALQTLRLGYGASVDSGRVAFSLSLDVDGIDAVAGTYGLQGKLDVGGLEAPSFSDLLRRVQQGTLYDAGGTVHPFFDRDLRALLSAGATLTLNRLLIDTPQGGIEASIALSLPDFDRTREWAGLMLGLSGNALLSVPQASVQPLSPGGEQLQQLLALGFFKPDGNRYRMEIEISKGRLTVNGAPLPFKLPSAQAF